MEKTKNWPPDYSIRYSRKAHRLYLRVKPETGLQVVLPYYASAARVPAVLEKHRQWILRAFQKVEASRPRDTGLPEALFLHGGRLCLPIRWDSALKRMPAIRLTPQECRLPDHGGETEAGRDLLKTWIRNYAAFCLPPFLHRLSERYGLPCSGIKIKSQKSRWGSCSAKGNINLNARLVFLPDELAYAVLLHELCHTRHLNHSPSFWALMASLDPEAPALDRRVNRAGAFVPDWWKYER